MALWKYLIINSLTWIKMHRFKSLLLFPPFFISIPIWISFYFGPSLSATQSNKNKTRKVKANKKLEYASFKFHFEGNDRMCLCLLYLLFIYLYIYFSFLSLFDCHETREESHEVYQVWMDQRPKQSSTPTKESREKDQHTTQIREQL